ncbi:MAG: hypothetical protein A2W23_02930 [Planctomycetes bacterium RBG_16_43_13]|nr:MAG: hypothetical protein A2W23_02930 [Planctomycetes bacterium RBG_16_43_13]
MRVNKLASTVLFAITFSTLITTALDIRSASGQEKNDEKKALQDKVFAETMRDLGIVTISKKDATIKEVLDDLRRQTRINIVLDTKNITDTDRITIELKEVPFKTALDAILDMAGLIVEQDTPQLIKITKPPRITLDMVGAPVTEVVNVIAKISGISIIISPDVKGSITLNVKDVPWMDLLDSVVKTVGFTTVKEKYNIVRIVDPKELRLQLETRVFTLKYIDPPQSYRAQVESNKYIKGATPTPPSTQDAIIKDFTILKIINTVLSKDATGKVIGNMEYDIKSKSLVVTDTKPALDKIESIISKLDIEPEQVLIDVKFVTTTNEDLLNFGMNFTSGADDGITVSANPVRDTTGTTPAESITRLPFAISSNYPGGGHYFLTQYDVTAMLRIFKRDAYSRIEQRPTIAALDGTEATIFVGESVPYATVTVTNDDGNVTTTITEGSKSPVKVGFQLFVIPTIVKDANKVIMTIIPQNELLTGTSATHPGFETFTAGGQVIDLPRISQTTAVTKMVIDSGLTAMLGGLTSSTTSLEERKLPLLGDIPIAGYAFKQKDESTIRTHLIIFITPRIVRGSSITGENLDALLKQRLFDEQRKLEELKKKEGEEELERIQEKRDEEAEKELEQLKKQ